jgi:hypothetical protein
MLPERLEEIKLKLIEKNISDEDVKTRGQKK